MSTVVQDTGQYPLNNDSSEYSLQMQVLGWHWAHREIDLALELSRIALSSMDHTRRIDHRWRYIFQLVVDYESHIGNISLDCNTSIDLALR